MKREPKSYSQCFSCSRLWDGYKEKCPHCGSRCLHYRTLMPLERTKCATSSVVMTALRARKSPLPVLDEQDNSGRADV